MRGRGLQLPRPRQAKRLVPRSDIALSTATPGFTRIGFGRSGLVIARGDFAGIDYSPDAGASWVRLSNGYPIEYQARHPIWLRAVAGHVNGNVLDLVHYTWADLADVGLESILLLISAMGQTNVAPTGGAGPYSTTSDGLFTLAAAGTPIITNAASNVTVRIAGDQANSVGGFLAETQAKAALLGAAGGGTPVYAAGEKAWFVPQGGNLWGASAGSVAKVYVDENV